MTINILTFIVPEIYFQYEELIYKATWPSVYDHEAIGFGGNCAVRLPSGLKSFYLGTRPGVYDLGASGRGGNFAVLTPSALVDIATLTPGRMRL